MSTPEVNQDGCADPTRIDRPTIAESAENKSWLRGASLALVAMAILIVALAVYHFAIVLPSLPRFAVVDVAELYRAKEAEFSKVLVDSKATDADRVKAMENAQRFAQDLQT